MVNWRELVTWRERKSFAFCYSNQIAAYFRYVICQYVVVMVATVIMVKTKYWLILNMRHINMVKNRLINKMAYRIMCPDDALSRSPLFMRFPTESEGTGMLLQFLPNYRKKFWR